MITDTTFFTNEPGYALLDRFVEPTLAGKRISYPDIGGEKSAKENQYLLLDDMNL
ncbi:MAG: hypothetical protein JRI62_00190 [Deltaproteobacteria bacterium]|nr:hypothetical protein [Deltaproteobacteria bacterium]